MKKIDLGQSITLLANIGVIVGIIFLAVELRQNTNVARGNAIQSIAQTVYEHNMRVAMDPGLRAIQNTLEVAGATGLSADQRRQLYGVFSALMVLQQNRFSQMQLGILDEASVFDVGGTGQAYRRPIFAEFWAENKHRYTSDFQEFMEANAPALAGSVQ